MPSTGLNSSVLAALPGSAPPNASPAVVVPEPAVSGISKLKSLSSVQDVPLNDSVVFVLTPAKANAAVAVPVPPNFCYAVFISLTSVQLVPFHDSVLAEVADPLGEPPKESAAVDSPEEAANKAV